VNAIAVDNPKYHFYKLAKHIAIPREDLMASHFPMTHIIMPGTSYSLGCIFKPFCIVGDFGHEIVYYNNQQYVMPHFGGVRIGKGVLIGSNTCVDAGLFDDTVIGDYTTIDNLCHIAHNVTIGKNCIIVAGSTIMGGVTIGDNTRVCSATIRDRLNVGSNVVVGMCSAVVEDAPDNCTVYGVPAKRR
jgi:UDP-3-O-[3-hydroxymyristoyl] glucosamine N-acyltransferase